MVSKEDAKAVYGRAFSRPPRLLFTNPVAFAFSLYYAYVYGMAVVLTLNEAFETELLPLGIIYLFLVALPLLYGKPPFSQPALFSYEWPLATMGLPYISMGILRLCCLVYGSDDAAYRLGLRECGGHSLPMSRPYIQTSFKD